MTNDEGMTNSEARIGKSRVSAVLHWIRCRWRCFSTLADLIVDDQRPAFQPGTTVANLDLDRLGPADLAHAEGFQEDDLVVMDNGDHKWSGKVTIIQEGGGSEVSAFGITVLGNGFQREGSWCDPSRSSVWLRQTESCCTVRDRHGYGFPILFL